MNYRKLIGWSSALCLSAIIAHAQETNSVDRFEQRLKEMQDSFEKRQQEMRENFERMMREHRQQIDALTNKLEELRKQQAGEAEKKKLEQELAAELQKGAPASPSNAPAPPLPAAAAWSAGHPITICRRGSAHMHPRCDALVDLGGCTAPGA